jgi:peptide/nickel transport system permease protein
MTKYIIRRLLQAIPLLFFISLILFVLMQATGDPIANLGGREPPRGEDRERLRRQLGLDQPIFVQYIFWLIGNDWFLIDRDGDGVGDTYGERLGILRGDFGESLATRQPAMEVIMQRIPDTLLLMGAAEIVIIVFALLVGVYSAIRQYSLLDNVMTGCSFVAFSMPVFFIGLSLLYIFAVQFKAWGLPHFEANASLYKLDEDFILSRLIRYMTLPVMTIAIISIAGYSRYIRSVMLEVLSSDYIRTARAKGLSSQRVLFVHALKNASLPLVTLIGLDIPLLLGGAVVTEQIYAWPGIGRMFVDHMSRSDFPVIMGVLMLISTAVVLFQIVTDVVYTWLDPRIRFT